MSNVDRKQMGLIVYDNPKAENKILAAAIDVTIDPIQYWRDRPLFLKKIIPPINKVIDSNENPQDYIEDDTILQYLDQIKQVEVHTDIYNETVAEIMDQFKKYSEINENENLDIEYPGPEADIMNIKIKDADGNVIQVVSTDLNQREKNMKQGVGVPVTLLDGIPADYTDNENPKEPDDTTIITLPDSYIKDKLWINADKYDEFYSDLDTATQEYTSELGNINDEVIADIPSVPSKDEILAAVVQDDIEVWYGIPLIALSPEDVPLEDSYILQIDTKHNWTLNVTNLVSGMNSEELRITEVQIPPHKRFAAGVFMNKNEITIFLMIEGDPTRYEKSITLTQEINLSVYAYGADMHRKKHICGTIWDYYLWESEPPYNVRPGGQLPYTPGDGWSYDGHYTRVKGDYVYTRRNWDKPALRGSDFGDWIDSGDWKLFYNTYVTNFFCRDELVGSDFTIFWYHYALGYPTGMRTLISDSIHNNYIRYDYDNFELVIDFNGKHFREHITLPEYMWYQAAIRLKIETGELVISFIDMWDDAMNEISVNIGRDTVFELISLWGRLNTKNGYYEEVAKGIMTYIVIQNKFMSTEELFELYFNHKSFLIEHDVKNMELPRDWEER